MAIRNSPWHWVDRNLRSWLGVGCRFAPNTAICLVALSITSPLLGEQNTVHLGVGGLLAACLVVLPPEAEWVVAVAAAAWIAASGVSRTADWCGAAAGVLVTNTAAGLQLLVVGVVVATVMASEFDVAIAISFSVASIAAAVVLWVAVVKSRSKAVMVDPEKGGGALIPGLLM